MSRSGARALAVGLLLFGIVLGLFAGFLASEVSSGRTFGEALGRMASLDPSSAGHGVAYSPSSTATPGPRPTRTAPTAAGQGLAPATAGDGSFASLVERCQPAVVAVGVVIHRQDLEEIRKRFRQQMPDMMEQAPEQPNDPSVPDQRFFPLGTGFVVDPKGVVATNKHVVDAILETGMKPSVRTMDGETLEAKVDGTDEETDLASLHVSPEQELPALAWGDSRTTSVGDWVIAIGNPFGLESSVSFGIVSGRGRQLVTPASPGAHTYDDYLQTDAAINPGNSGGPLINMRGQVVGINSAIQTDTPIASRAGSIGIGFAIPSTLAQYVVGELASKGEVVRGYIGVQLPTAEAERESGQRVDGALLSKVDSSGPAGRAGLRDGDVVTEYDGDAVHTSKELVDAVAVTPVGSRVELKYDRDRHTGAANVVIARRPPVNELENVLSR